MTIGVTLLVSACGGGTRESDLKRPYYLVDRESGLCGNAKVVDAEGVQWGGGGCENGASAFQSSGEKLNPEAVDEIRAAFDALPAADAVCPGDGPNYVAGAYRYTFRRVTPEENVRWVGCTSSGWLDPPFQNAGSHHL